jgi:crotonobetainyl-CoA:carnitine CoA-transferase CaiB-like acyl-CoA transferase
MQAPGALDGIRVIDLATARGELAGRLLADLGAEVIKIEPPSGAQARQRAPFVAGHEGDPGASLYWASVALGKRSVVLDVFEPASAAQLLELLRGADVLIESFAPGTLAAVGLDAAAVARVNPALVYASITPFGQDGPLAQAPATDLTLEAAGALLGLQGPGDRPPLPCGFPQASFHAGAQAAADICVALCERLRSGLGQHIDVSTQSAIVWTLLNATGFAAVTGHDPPGTGATRADPRPQLLPGLELHPRTACRDGYTQVALALPGLGERTLQAVLQWAERSGELPEELRKPSWKAFIRDVVEGDLDIEVAQRGVAALYAFLAGRTKREIQDFAVQERVLLGPIYDVADLRDDPQLRSREYWTQVGGHTHPGAFARLSETPLRLQRPAPELGQDQHLLGEPRCLAVDRVGEPSDEGVFAGLKVADFSWAAAGPIIAKTLADQGATVVHVESQTRLDVTRTAPPFLNDERDINRAHMVVNYNTSKLGMTLDLSTPGGRQLARDLSDWADVVIESFTPGTMEKHGLDWESLSSGRTDLVMLSTSLRGQTGPERRYAGYGSQGAALAGLESVTGWPDRAPVGPWGAYTDFIAPRYGVAALAAALHHRARTGRGQYIDLGQVEAAIHFLEPLVLDYTVNGRVAGRVGHTSLYACPHATYRCAGRERYVAIAIELPEQWDALRSVAPLEEFAEASLRQLEARMARRDAIESRLRDWCATQDAFELAERLRAAGAPAYAVLRPSDLAADPQLAHRGFFVSLDHPVMGPTLCDGPVSRYSRTPPRLRCAGPLLGEHTQHVLRELLGLSDEEVSQLAIGGALT